MTIKMTKIPPKLGRQSLGHRPFYDTAKELEAITDITKEMQENYWGASMLRNLDFEAARVFAIPNAAKANHEQLIRAARAACKGKIAALITDTSLKIALENDEDAVLLKMFL